MLQEVDLEEENRGSLPPIESMELERVNSSGSGRAKSFLESRRARAGAAVVGGVLVVLLFVLVLRRAHPPVGSDGDGPPSEAPGGADRVTKWTKAHVDSIVGPNGDYAESGKRTKEWLRALTRKPHVAGTDNDRDTATLVAQAFKDSGLPRVDTREYKVLINYPKAGSVEIVSPADRVFKANLREPTDANVPVTGEPDVTRAFHGFSASGNATAAVVYANYATVEDFEELKRLGVSVEGKIVLARYGKVFRGNKVDNAQERGAVGVLIFSDPADDGYSLGKVFPDGPWRAPGSVQRGSVFIGEGDPLTPGYAAVDGAHRITMDEARRRDFAPNLGFSLPSIPSIPLSYRDAGPIMAGLGGQVAPRAFAGGLVDADGNPLTYRLGDAGEPLVVNMLNEMEERREAPIWNVFGVIEGSVEPDRAVVLGNHRDAWVGGAVDPSSGTASLLELARSFGEMYQSGWRPRRTLILASWDMEEYGLVGSVEWGEEFEASLGARAVAYLNCDESVTGPGPIRVSSSPSLIESLLAAAKEVPQPPIPGHTASGDSMYDVWLEFQKKEDPSLAEPTVGGLGSGSDQAVFLHHLGITSADITVDGRPPVYGQYHSSYDSFEWMEKFGDPSWTLHPAVSAYWGAVAIRLAEAPIVPLDYVRVAAYLRGWVPATKQAAAAAGMTRLDFSRLDAQIDRLEQVARAAAEERDALSTGAATDISKRVMSDRIMLAERAFLAPGGLPGRPWFRHTVLSPGSHNSYAAEKFPGVSDAIFERDEDTAVRQLDAVARGVSAVADFLGTKTVF